MEITIMTDKTYRVVTGGCSFSKRADLPIMTEQEKTWTNAIEESFEFPFECYERCANGKGAYKNRGNKKILNMKYTPDFIGKGWIIECKGRANESFPLRWKIFKKLVAERRLGPFTLYKPQNQKECDKTVELILKQDG